MMKGAVQQACRVCGVRFGWPEPTPPYCLPHLWQRFTAAELAALDAQSTARRLGLTGAA